MGQDIVKPSVDEVQKYLDLWDSLENYRLQESSLRKLFLITYPHNTDLDDVLIKVCTLNDFYSTNIYSPFTVAKHIVELRVDDALARGDLDVVNKIADVKMSTGKKINFYSFASKYCNHHNPGKYPIYDNYVEKMLMYWKRKDGFGSFKRTDLKIYIRFRDILEKFRQYYHLETFDLKQIDKYLWQAGKEYFPKKY